MLFPRLMFYYYCHFYEASSIVFSWLITNVCCGLFSDDGTDKYCWYFVTIIPFILPVIKYPLSKYHFGVRLGGSDQLS